MNNILIKTTADMYHLAKARIKDTLKNGDKTGHASVILNNVTLNVSYDVDYNSFTKYFTHDNKKISWHKADHIVLEKPFPYKGPTMFEA